MIESSPLSNGSADGVSSPDFIYGAEEIARFLGISVRKVYYFMERRKLGKGHIPINNLPSIGLCASRKALVDYLNGQRQG
ncbi:MAG: hypothetical protein WCD70_14220 [Alphaproteobacteria bacterium]